MPSAPIPLIDLHRHLDGSVRLETILDLADQHGIELPATDLESLKPLVQVSGAEADLMAFIERFRYLTAVMVDADACRRIAQENVEDLAAEDISYAELRFSPCFMAETHGLDPSELVEAVIDGVRSGVQETGIETGCSWMMNFQQVFLQGGPAGTSQQALGQQFQRRKIRYGLARRTSQDETNSE